jgi:hypothetical protein
MGVMFPSTREMGKNHICHEPGPEHVETPSEQLDVKWLDQPDDPDEHHRDRDWLEDPSQYLQNHRTSPCCADSPTHAIGVLNS